MSQINENFTISQYINGQFHLDSLNFISQQHIKFFYFSFISIVKKNKQKTRKKNNLILFTHTNKMGSESSIQQRKEKFYRMFSNNYQLAEKRDDEIFGLIQIFRNKSTKIPEIMVKKINYREENEFKIIFDELNSRIIKPLPNLLGIYSLQIHKQSTFCGTLYEVKIYVEYLEHNLKIQLIERRNSNFFFSQEKLWKILISLNNAIKHLHENGIFHGEIRVENVLIDSDYHVKLTEKLLLPETNWEVELQAQNVKLIKGKGVLFSPILLMCLFHKKTQLAEFNPFKADVYAVGMIMLQCSSLKKAQDFYDYDKFSIKTKQIFATLYEIRKRYSAEFCNLLSKMLEEEDNERLSANEVFSKIRRIPKETMQQLNLKLNDSFIMDSIKSYM